MARILVPLDGSQLAEEALAWATTLANARGDSIHLVSVYSPDEQMWEAAQIDPTTGIHGVRAQLATYLEKVAKRADLAGIAVSHEVRPGEVAAVIAESAAEGETGLVVITTHGRGGFDGSGRGSVADKLIRTLRVPVVVIRPHLEAGAISSLAVPLDGSKDAESALVLARDLAGKTGASIHLVSAVDPALTWNFPEAGGATAQDHLRSRAEAYLDRLRAPHELASVETGRPSTVITDHARLRDCQMVVMATHGRSGAVRLDLGSVADEVVRKATCPVLLIPIGRQAVAGSVEDGGKAARMPGCDSGGLGAVHVELEAATDHGRDAEDEAHRDADPES